MMIFQIHTVLMENKAGYMLWGHADSLTNKESEFEKEAVAKI